MTRIEGDYKALHEAMARLQRSIRNSRRASPTALALFAVPIASPERVDELLMAELSGVGEMEHPRRAGEASVLSGGAARGEASPARSDIDELLAREFGAVAEPATRTGEGVQASPTLTVVQGDRLDELLRAELGVAPSTGGAGPSKTSRSGASRAERTGGRFEPDPGAGATDVDTRLELLLRSLINREFLPETAVPEWYSRTDESRQRP